MTACSIVVTCKGRLEHLKRSLPAMLRQATEVVVVDFDCPDATSAWVAGHHPAARVVKVGAAPIFNAARARNLGAAAARGDWLFFIDADIVPGDRLRESLLPGLDPVFFYRPAPMQRQFWGTLLVPRARFLQVDGYDEVIVDYGGEDDDLYLRLQQAGMRQSNYPAQWLSEIPHDNALRGQYHALSDIRTSQRANSLYVAAKADTARLLGRPLVVAERQALFDEVRRAVLAAGAGGEPNVTITLPDADSLPVQLGWHLRRHLVLSLLPLDPAAAGTLREQAQTLPKVPS